MSSITATTKGKDQHLDRLEVWEAGGVKHLLNQDLALLHA